MSILKLEPSFKDYIWGGHKLVTDFNKKYDGEVLAESWELSCHPDGPSKIANGTYKGKTLEEYIQAEGKKVLGKNAKRFEEFPILVKLIDAKDNLSIQVHPDNQYALKNEGQYGKTEMWYVVDCKEDSFLYYGFSKEIDKEEFRRRIQENTLLEVLNAVPVQKGDVLFIESGTIHAICKDIVVAEIQQNSNITYRVYDYGRVGADGKQRDLHIEKALAVTNCVPIVRKNNCNPHVARCDYFTVDKLNLDGSMMKKMSGMINEDSFLHLLILEGKGKITVGEETFEFQKGDSYFLPAGTGAYEIVGTCEALVTTIGEKQSPIRIGIDLGGTNTKIGLVDEKNRVFATDTIPTKTNRPYQEVIKDIADAVTRLLENNNILMDDCIGIGMGIPGTIDEKNGVVLYSNNFNWDQVPISKELHQYIPLPIYINNDANCAVLGEVIHGAAKGYKDVVMLTLGTGVGGGVVLDGKLFDGHLLGGCELGHSVIVADGEPCTCGRKGCLEAYVSATALIRDAKKKMQERKDTLLWEYCGGNLEKIIPEQIFKAAKAGDQIAAELVERYVGYLGDGIVNIVNVFRPEMVLIGGGISAQGEGLICPINKKLKENCFAKNYGSVPEVRIAELGNQAGLVGAANLV